MELTEEEKEYLKEELFNFGKKFKNKMNNKEYLVLAKIEFILLCKKIQNKIKRINFFEDERAKEIIIEKNNEEIINFNYDSPSLIGVFFEGEEYIIL